MNKKPAKEKKKSEKKEEKAAKKPAAPPKAFSAVESHRAAELREDEDQAVSPLWLITFTDTMALMLTFFVLLYAMSVPEEEKWVDVTAALNTEFNKFFSQKFEAGPEDSINISKLNMREALSLDYLRNLIVELIQEEKGLDNVIVLKRRDNLVLSLPQDLLFESGQAEVNERGIKALFALGGVLSRIKNRIEVMGHADPRPIQGSGGAYPSNWELSLARAAAVAAVLENVGYRRPVVVRGVSSARYEDLPESISEEERLDLSRRVDIVIMKDDGSGQIMLDFGPL